MRHLLDLSREESAAWLDGEGLPSYRDAQIRRWVYAGRVASFAEMTDLPAALRERLSDEFQIFTSRVAAHSCRSPPTV